MYVDHAKRRLCLHVHVTIMDTHTNTYIHPPTRKYMYVYTHVVHNTLHVCISVYWGPVKNLFHIHMHVRLVTPGLDQSFVLIDGHANMYTFVHLSVYLCLSLHTVAHNLLTSNTIKTTKHLFNPFLCTSCVYELWVRVAILLCCIY